MTPIERLKELEDNELKEALDALNARAKEVLE